MGPGAFVSLDPSRIDLSAKCGHWPLGDWLPIDLYMAFIEFLALGRPLPNLDYWVWQGPGSDSNEVWLALYHKLETAGLLLLSRGSRHPVRTCAAFNVVKNAQRDRLIVDRRGPNGLEAKIVGGPSSQLFPAYRLCELLLGRGRLLRASGCDRKDMYFQCAATPQRAATNPT